MKKLTLITLLLLTMFTYSCSDKTVKNETEKGTTEKSLIINVGVDEFKRIIAEGNAKLIDARTPNEFNAGHIEGATMIDVRSASFSEKTKQLDKSVPVMVYCKSGKRSMKAANILKSQGFSKIYNLRGGYKAWTR